MHMIFGLALSWMVPNYPLGGGFAASFVRQALIAMKYSYLLFPVCGLFGPSLTSVWLQVMNFCNSGSIQYHAHERQSYNGTD